MTAFSKVLVTVAFAVTTKTRSKHRHYVLPSSMTAEPTTSLADTFDLANMCSLLGVISSHTLLKLETDLATGIRGVYTTQPTTAGEIILQLPLTSCLVDSNPPAWFQPEQDGIMNLQQSSQWATRLAALLLDHPPSIWVDLLPDPAKLRSSLPIHWTENVILSTQCTALELAVDSAYFSRAQAVADLMDGLLLLRETDMDNDNVVQQMKQQCEDALDIVQTRSCQLNPDGLGSPVRVVAPIFDFINHAGTAANAFFQQEKDHLVVRAKCDILMGQEVTIDYGHSAKPAWRCLVSYGFVPTQQNDDSVAELCLNGFRYDVGPSTIPYALVKAEQQAMVENGYLMDNTFQGEMSLTPSIALNLAKRVADVAFQLILENQDTKVINEFNQPDNPEEDMSHKLAEALRLSHHRTLLGCAIGLQHWAAGTESQDMTGVSP